MIRKISVGNFEVAASLRSSQEIETDSISLEGLQECAKCRLDAVVVRQKQRVESIETLMIHLNDVMHGACFTRSFLFQTGSLALPKLFVLAVPQSYSVPANSGVHKEPTVQ